MNPEDPATKINDFITRVFQQKKLGNEQFYQQLLRLFHDRAPPASLAMLFHSLTKFVSAFRQDFSELVSVVLAFKWSPEHDEVNERYCDFLVSLVSCNQYYLQVVMERLVLDFLPMLHFEGGHGPRSPEELNVSEKRSQYSHKTLSRILALAPISGQILINILTSRFPYRKMDVETHTFYTKNLIQIISYFPMLRDRILLLIVEKLVQIDVEIKLDDDEEDLQFDVELEEKKHDTEADETPEQANKLDQMMDLVFAFLRQNCALQTVSPSASSPKNPSDQLFEILLFIFDTTIIKTFKSKFTQFLLFYLCSLKPVYSELFLAYLLNKLLDNSTSTLTKQLCVSYAGSFIARANYLPNALIQQTLGVFFQWVDDYLTKVGDTNTNTNASPTKKPHNSIHITVDNATTTTTTNNNSNLIPDAELHGVFYSICQFIMYIFCFKQNLFEEGKEYKNLIERMVRSPLTPTRFCLPSVVKEFCKGVESRNILKLSDLVSQSEKLLLPTKTVRGGDNQLESYFPFDPYLLKNSSKFITNIYTEWRAPKKVNQGTDKGSKKRTISKTGERYRHGRDDESDDDSEEDSEEEEEEEEEEGEEEEENEDQEEEEEEVVHKNAKKIGFRKKCEEFRWSFVQSPFSYEDTLNIPQMMALSLSPPFIPEVSLDVDFNAFK
eukprot:TRINITY_DN828_c0_g3_i2.p1 TRINITY_DN828_c0_g3~~TRINITY_DN828_c0_g3_i2.p1  ORF type:complete len:666 (+),score=208.21 TRINITY_DN828_c0_g3_i2:67-2064(+)